MSRTLLVLLDPAAPGEAVAEVLRLTLAATASGPVRVITWGAPGETREHALTEEAETTLTHVRARDVNVAPSDDASLHDALREADDVWCCLRRDTSCTQDLLVVTDAWLDSTSPALLRQALTQVRHVIRART